ncbi:MAG: ComEC/Rec2 family competence protein [Bacteroidales bacterium]
MKSYEGLKKIPMLRLLIPFILGIIIQDKIGVQLFFVIPASLILFLLICIILKYEHVNPDYRRIWFYGLALNLFVLTVSMGLTQGRRQSFFFTGYNKQDSFFSAIIMEYPEEKNNSYRLIIEPEWIIAGDRILGVSGMAVAWMEKNSSAALLRAGDRIVLLGSFREIINQGNPFEFDYQRHMYVQGISGEIYLHGDSWFLPEGESRSSGIKLKRNALRLRHKLLEKLRYSGIGGKEYSVAAAILLGYNSALDHETRQLFAVAGAMHILAVSGLHVGILYILLIRVAGFFRIRKNCFLSNVIIILVIWFYAFLTGLSPSVIRSATMFTFLAIARKTGQSTTVLNTIASAALFQLLVDPYSLFMVGFQLSYLAVSGIVHYQPFIYSLFRFSSYVSDKIWTLCTISFSAQIFIFPLCLYYFNQFPNYFLLTNVLVVPLAMLILYSGFFFFLFSFIPIISGGLAFILESALMFLNFLTEAVSDLPLAQTTGIVVNYGLLAILFGIIITLTLFLFGKKIRFLQYSLLLVIASLVLRADHIIGTDRQNIFIVYNARNHSLFNFISGNDNIIVGSGPDIHDNAYMPYIASRPALYLNAGNTSIIAETDFFSSELSDKSLPVYITGDFVFFAGNRIYFARSGESENLTTKTDVYVDILVITARSSMTLDFIGRAVIPEIVVIDSSVSYRQKLKIIEYCKERGFEFHDVSDCGSFIAGM